MKTISQTFLASAILAVSISTANAEGSSACDGQKIIFTNATNLDLYLVEHSITGSAFFNGVGADAPIAAHTEHTIEISSGDGTHGNSTALMSFSKSPSVYINSADVEFNFNSGWSNYFSCSITNTLKSNSDFFVTSHTLADGIQVIFYPKDI